MAYFIISVTASVSPFNCLSSAGKTQLNSAVKSVKCQIKRTLRPYPNPRAATTCEGLVINWQAIFDLVTASSHDDESTLQYYRDRLVQEHVLLLSEKEAPHF